MRLGSFAAVVHEGVPTGAPTLVALTRAGKVQRGKAAVCPFCEHVHPKDVHTRLADEGLGQDALLLAADLDDRYGKVFRAPEDAERMAAEAAVVALKAELQFAPGMPAEPDEAIPPGNSDTIRASMYGARRYADLCNSRQTLAFVRLARAIADVGLGCRAAGVSNDYAAALCGYAGAVLVRKLRRSTRGAALQPIKEPKSNRVKITDVFSNEASVAFSYDYFEAGLGDGPGTWPSLGGVTLAVVRSQAARSPGRPGLIRRGTAVALPLPTSSVDAVVTDPPYDEMIDYADASDMFFVWLKRALASTHPDFGLTADPRGVQEKTEEIIVKRGGAGVGDHRTRDFYDTMLARSFAEARRVVRDDGVVTIVFGHGDPEVWHRLLGAITAGGLYLTGSWPAKTEAGEEPARRTSSRP